MYIVKFTPNSLDTFTVENTYSTSPSLGSRFALGERVPVIFLKDDPEVARFNTFNDLSFSWIGGVLMGVFLIGFACFLILKSEAVARVIRNLKQSDL
ncbi:MAG: hypothetical protein NVV82_27175 [Sporocytophaga sp.]|nr:hypothetical protein [Sporocytophaga sp.]